MKILGVESVSSRGSGKVVLQKFEGYIRNVTSHVPIHHRQPLHRSMQLVAHPVDFPGLSVILEIIAIFFMLQYSLIRNRSDSGRGVVELASGSPQ